MSDRVGYLDSIGNVDGHGHVKRCRGVGWDPFAGRENFFSLSLSLETNSVRVN